MSLDTRKAAAAPDLVARHLRAGWYALLVFSSLGLVLEMLHAFKVSAYLDVGADTRRLMWRLGHAHGVLLGLVNVAFAATVARVARAAGAALSRWRFASACLLASTLLLPLGFWLGGAFAEAGDPGLPIVLVPAGATLLIVGIYSTARLLSSRATTGEPPPPEPKGH